MAIISAGVVMNVLLGMACFVYAYGHGMMESPAKISGVLPGSPAYKAGLRSGDEIVAIDGRRDISFKSLLQKVALSGTGQVLRLEIQRPGRDGRFEVGIQPIRESRNEHPTIGILQGQGLAIGTFYPPAGMADPPTYPGLDRVEDDVFIDTLAAAGRADREPRPLADHDDYESVLTEDLERPITHRIERRKSADGPVRERLELTVPPAHFVDFGLWLTIEPISAVQPGSPAEAAGFRPGDRIVKVGDDSDFDPMRLPDLCRKNAGRPMTFEVERSDATGAPKVRALTATPERTYAWTPPPLSREVDIPGLGLCYPVSPRVARVKPESPAARAGLKPGDVLNAMTFKRSKTAKAPGGKLAGSDRDETLKFDDGSSNWVDAFRVVQARRDVDVELVVNKGSQPVPIRAEPDPTWYHPSRGLIFLTVQRKLPPQPIAAALHRGLDDTVENILSIYAMLRSLATRRVSPSSMGGVITISRIAFGAAQMGLTYLIYFLGLLSINLAVINFLPIPPLDGGQMAFLVAEKVRGRPLPESAVVAGTYFGLFLVLGVLIFVTCQDIIRVVF
jgi:regulator of sigma E protease